jgi:hypothetical protein
VLFELDSGRLHVVDQSDHVVTLGAVLFVSHQIFLIIKPLLDRKATYHSKLDKLPEIR